MLQGSGLAAPACLPALADTPAHPQHAESRRRCTGAGASANHRGLPPTLSAARRGCCGALVRTARGRGGLGAASAIGPAAPAAAAAKSWGRLLLSARSLTSMHSIKTA